MSSSPRSHKPVDPTGAPTDRTMTFQAVRLDPEMLDAPTVHERWPVDSDRTPAELPRPFGPGGQAKASVAEDEALVAGRFRMTKQLGAGATGTVFLAADADGRTVVVKRLHAHLALPGSSAVQRFEREARAVEALSHPHIVGLVDHGQSPDGSRYLVMEYAEGRTLAEVIDSEGAMPERRALYLACQISAALAHAHEAGIIHRDLKPENIMLCGPEGGETVKVLDFGLAKMLGPSLAGSTQLTRAGDVYGTPRYMAPEQARGERVDARVDVYGIGVLLYELLAGEPPFVAESPVHYLVMHSMEEPPPLDAKVSGVSTATSRIVMCCIEKDPGRRFQTATALCRALESAQERLHGAA